MYPSAKFWQDSERPRHYCGIFGVYGVPDAPRVIYRGLFALQHRGQEGAGIVVSDGRTLRTVRGGGLVSEVVLRQAASFAELRGAQGIGHVRYSTTGASELRNVQPIAVECADGIWAIAHNGNLTNAAALRRAYQEEGSIFQTSTDSEILLHLIAHPRFRLRPRRVQDALAELQGAFSFLLMNRDTLIAVRDRYGFRPLSIGRLGDGYVFASETCALDLVGAEHVRDVRPGEMVTVDARGFRSDTFCPPVSGTLGQCIFEHVYFARPDSDLFGESVHRVRVRLGELLAEEHPVSADAVIAIPDSGMAAALGFSRRSGIPLDYGFIRNHYVGRTFIMPTPTGRAESVDMKLAVVSSAVAGKRVVVVDDSLIRGTTSRRRIHTLREAGATEVHVRIASPPVRSPCYFGIDFPSRKELVAADRDVEGIRRFIGADSLGYLSPAGLLSAVEEPGDFCSGCFTGRYPVDVSGEFDKLALEAQRGGAA